MSFKYHLNSVYPVLYIILPCKLGWSRVNFLFVNIHFPLFFFVWKKVELDFILSDFLHHFRKLLGLILEGTLSVSFHVLTILSTFRLGLESLLAFVLT